MGDFLHQATSPGFWLAFFQIVLIDVTLASDNAVAIGMAAANLPPPKRRQAIIIGLAGAVLLLGTLAFFATHLLKVGGGGLLLAGGLLLLLVGWQMWRDLRAGEASKHKHHGKQQPASLGKALSLILIADISTSLDNVLAVAGVARDQPPWLLFLGLAISIGLTGLAAMGVAKFMQKWPWLGYVGLVVVLYVALHMMWDGAEQLHLIHI